MTAYDAVTPQVLLFGQASARTWAWNGVTWTSQSPAASPPGRNVGTMTDNTADSRILLFGGQTRDGPSMTCGPGTVPPGNAATKQPRRVSAVVARSAAAARGAG
jgi:hypothetical protein